jgi:CRP-like cAMP-binding protein
MRPPGPYEKNGTDKRLASGFLGAFLTRGPAIFILRARRQTVSERDGRRQIGGFYLQSDIFGISIGKEHQFSAEAINNATVLVVRRGTIISLAERDCDAARELWSFAGRELNRIQEHLLLVVKSAQRLRCFLAARNVYAAPGDRCHRASDVESGYRRLSRAHDRDRVAHHDSVGVRAHHRAAELPLYRTT